MSKLDIDKICRAVLKYAVLILFFWGVIFFIYWFSNWCLFWTMNPNEFGDLLAGWFAFPAAVLAGTALFVQQNQARKEDLSNANAAANLEMDRIDDEVESLLGRIVLLIANLSSVSTLYHIRAPKPYSPANRLNSIIGSKSEYEVLNEIKDIAGIISKVSCGLKEFCELVEDNHYIETIEGSSIDYYSLYNVLVKIKNDVRAIDARVNKKKELVKNKELVPKPDQAVGCRGSELVYDQCDGIIGKVTQEEWDKFKLYVNRATDELENIFKELN